jgi:YebC/PmpR family DNA-binding regulatory protein
VIAVKAGGPDPESNARLRAVIQNAKAANMPKDNVERAIKKASDKNTEDYKEMTLEGYAPHGIAIIVESATNNNNRTVANVRSYFNKTNGSLGTTGSVDFMFTHQAHFKIVDLPELDLEEFEFELIDFGAEEVFREEADDEETNAQDAIVIYGPFASFGTIQGFLEKNDYEIISSGFDRLPMQTKKLTPEQELDVEKLLAKFDDDEDVQNVYHNME